jgi:hypothetical protein
MVAWTLPAGAGAVRAGSRARPAAARAGVPVHGQLAAAAPAGAARHQAPAPCVPGCVRAAAEGSGRLRELCAPRQGERSRAGWRDVAVYRGCSLGDAMGTPPLWCRCHFGALSSTVVCPQPCGSTLPGTHGCAAVLASGGACHIKRCNRTLKPRVCRRRARRPRGGSAHPAGDRRAPRRQGQARRTRQGRSLGYGHRGGLLDMSGFSLLAALARAESQHSLQTSGLEPRPRLHPRRR